MGPTSFTALPPPSSSALYTEYRGGGALDDMLVRRVLLDPGGVRRRGDGVEVRERRRLRVEEVRDDEGS
jgi:hypothetical protein